MADYQARAQQYQQQQHTTDALKNFLPENGPTGSQVLAVFTLLPIGGTLLFLAGLTFVGTLIGLVVSTPLFVIFSPILIPAALVIGLGVTGFLTSGAFGITALSSITWLANYLRRMRESSNSSFSISEQAEQAKLRLQDTADYMGHKTKDAGQAVQNKAQETAERTQTQETTTAKPSEGTIKNKTKQKE